MIFFADALLMIFMLMLYHGNRCNVFIARAMCIMIVLLLWMAEFCSATRSISI